MRLDPSERINPEPITFRSSPSAATSNLPLWTQIALGIVLGGVVLFLCWFGYHKYQEYRLTKAIEAASQGFQQSMQRISEQSRQASLEARQRLEAENRARSNV
ncbi:tetratricopeptide repeat protein [Marinobacterium weihaiense]|uniref:Tetratricopeptide repeat protein n=1 Tax=Marinobacterium weihaiense TaxID=2851016 RepID=A0ABS6MDV8_9GAMM|nr:tetratricopeptide repeat protein [Marinobacterium weihaiense]MBV0934473.1 tetratricopeptide repeat protein [Marinobacterium weihaiense]